MISYSQKVDDVYENIEDYIPKKKQKVLIVLCDVMLANMKANKKLKPIVAILIKRERANDIFFYISFFLTFSFI